jgi:hypothetical protein
MKFIFSGHVAKLCSLFLLALSSVGAEAGNLVANGGFEDIPLGAARGAAYVPGSSIGGWSVTGNNVSVVVTNNIGSLPTNMAIWPQAQEGTQYLYLNNNATTNASIFQNIALLGDTKYHLSFYLNGLQGFIPYYNPYQPSVIVSLLAPDSSQLINATVQGTTNTTWTRFDFDVTAATAGAYRLAFAAPANPVLPGDHTWNFITLDNIQLAEFPSPVPEPETLTMMIAGLGLLGAVARRKTRN